MQFVDLHAHPVFKTLFNSLTPWDAIPARDHLIGDIIESQSNLEQITDNGECNLICMTLHPPEVGMLDQWLWNLAPLFTRALDRGIMGEMISGNLDYQEVLHKELSNLQKTPTNHYRTKSIVVLGDFKQYDPQDFSKIFFIFNIEGGHTFYNPGNKHEDKQQILDDFRKFVTRTDLLVLYITPTHLTPNIFITHAYGNKILGKGKFLPKKSGISNYGEAFLNEIANTHVLVDVEHMSVVSRQSFYKNGNWNKKPVLCSHAGVTGCSWHDRLNAKVVLHSIKCRPGFVKIRYVKPCGLLEGTYCNPCSINLYDEDIIAILNSGGIIGLSFDLRIVGGDMDILHRLKLREKEFLSPEEFEIWKCDLEEIQALNQQDFDFPYAGEMINEEVGDDVWDDEDRQDEMEELNGLSRSDIPDLFEKSILVDDKSRGNHLLRDRKLEHARFFANQILYIVKVAKDHGLNRDPWKQICIGSDFDGLIRAIDSSKNISHLDEFGDLLTGVLNEAQEVGITLPKSPRELVADVFFNNAFNFISNHLRLTKNFA